MQKDYVEEAMNTIVQEWLQLLSADQREEFEERAGIIQYDSGTPRSEAEALALLCVLKRHPEILSGTVRAKEDLI